jgi:hypothetical protein
MFDDNGKDKTMYRTRCGKELNAQGNPYTLQGLRDHTMQCPKCIQKLGGLVSQDTYSNVAGRRYRIINGKKEYVGYLPEVTYDLSKDFEDLPDAAYWAMRY